MAVRIELAFADAHAYLAQNADLPIASLLILPAVLFPITMLGHYTRSRFAPFYITSPLTAAPEQELDLQNLRSGFGYVGLKDLQSFVSYSNASADLRPPAAMAAAIVVYST